MRNMQRGLPLSHDWQILWPGASESELPLTITVLPLGAVATAKALTQPVWASSGAPIIEAPGSSPPFDFDVVVA